LLVRLIGSKPTFKTGQLMTYDFVTDNKNKIIIINKH
jgi:hypothetical protein